MADSSPGLLVGFGNLKTYVSERFPVAVTLLLGLALAAAAYATAQQETLRAGSPLLLDGTALGGCALVFLFLFHLRVFDEHKDYELDAATRPDRPVQRGVITLDQLKLLGVIAVALQIVLAVLPGVEIAAYYAIPLLYSVLMFFEFFAKEWLTTRFVIYALTHTIVMSMLALALAVRFSMRAEIGISTAVWGLLGLCVTSFFAVDTLRKTWAPETEREGLDSYSKNYGIAVAGWIDAGLIVASAILGGWLGWLLGGRYVWLGVVALVTLWGLAEIRGFVRAPAAKREKRLELVAGVHLLVIFIGLAVVAAAANGVVFGFANLWVSVGV